MKILLLFAGAILVVFLAFGTYDRIRSARAEHQFHSRRVECQSNLLRHWRQRELRSVGISAEEGHYYSIDWSAQPEEFRKISKRPLMYDRRMSNHEGRGINILMADGSIDWDRNGEWLRKFVADHPNLQLPVPEP